MAWLVWWLALTVQSATTEPGNWVDAAAAARATCDSVSLYECAVHRQAALARKVSLRGGSVSVFVQVEDTKYEVEMPLLKEHCRLAPAEVAQEAEAAAAAEAAATFCGEHPHLPLSECVPAVQQRLIQAATAEAPRACDTDREEIVPLSLRPWSDGMDSIRMLDGLGPLQTSLTDYSFSSDRLLDAPGATAADVKILRRLFQIGEDMLNEGMHVRVSWLLADLPALVGFPVARVPTAVPRSALGSIIDMVLPSFQGRLHRTLALELGAEADSSVDEAMAVVARTLEQRCTLRRRMRDAVVAADLDVVKTLLARAAAGSQAREDTALFAFEAVVELRQRRCAKCEVGEMGEIGDCCASHATEGVVCQETTVAQRLQVFTRRVEPRDATVEAVIEAAIATAGEHVDEALQTWRMLVQQFPQAVRLESGSHGGYDGGSGAAAAAATAAVAWQVCEMGRRAPAPTTQGFDRWVRRLESVASAPGTFCPRDFFSFQAMLEGLPNEDSDYKFTAIPIFIHANEDQNAVLKAFTAHEGLNASASAQMVERAALERGAWDLERAARKQGAGGPASDCVDPARIAAHNKHFFVEIGSSDFGNLHQQLFLNTSWSGLAVEPMHELVSVLPHRPGLFKEQAALGCGAGVESLSMLGVTRANQQAFGLPRWSLGTGSVVSDVHEQAAYENIYGEDWWAAVVRTEVRCLSWADLAAKNNIHATCPVALPVDADDPSAPYFNVNLLKVDAEYVDVLVLNELMDWLELAERGRSEDEVTVYPSHITFEIFRDTEGLSDALRERYLMQDPLFDRLHLLGYECATEGKSDVQCLRCTDTHNVLCQDEQVARSANSARRALAAIRHGCPADEEAYCARLSGSRRSSVAATRAHR
jgi:hypothetical protein